MRSILSWINIFLTGYKKVVIGIYLFSCLMFTLSAEVVSLSGRVVSEEMIPIDNVVILSEERYLTVTDEDGVFYLENAHEEWSLTFYRYGYHLASINVRDLGEQEVIILTRDAVKLPNVTIRREQDNISGLSQMRLFIPITPEMRGMNLVDIMNEYPEISITGLSLRGERQTVSVLGHHTRHTLVLLDGVPLNSSGQPFDISAIPTDIIESIEIIKGGAAAYKGAGAIGGLININTKHPVNSYDIFLSQTIGSFGSYKTAASFYHRRQWLGISLYADRNQAKNDFVYYDSNDIENTRRYNDKFYQNLHLRLSGHFSQFTTLYKLEFFDFANKLPGPTNYEILYQNARLDGLSVYNYFSFVGQFSSLNPELIFYHHRNRTKYDNTRAPNSYYYIISKHSDDKMGLQMSIYSPFDHLINQLINYYIVDNLLEDQIHYEQKFQAEYYREDFSYQELTNEVNSLPEIRQENYSLSSVAKLIIPIKDVDWSHSLAARWDTWQRETTNSASNVNKDNFLSYRYDTAITLFHPILLNLGGGISKNYSLPSFYDLYWKGDSQTTGNPDLKMEKSTNYNAFGEFTMYNLTPRLEFHQSKIDDLIYWYRSITGWKPGNIAAAEISNWKISADYRFNDLFKLSLSWLKTTALNKSRNLDGSPSDLYDKKLLYTPEESWHITAAIRPKPFFVRLSHFYTGVQWSTPDQLIQPLDDYNLTNVEIGLIFEKLQLNWQISLTLNNIFDTRYEIYAYTPQPGFNWLLNLKINYNH
ncbi:MAG: TonB-dependent receptor [Candidatus Cloacimonetes bacterium]|nr:TonB-dependent receptor [Candidatus Cloacimonadota bacterium]